MLLPHLSLSSPPPFPRQSCPQRSGPGRTGHRLLSCSLFLLRPSRPLLSSPLLWPLSLHSHSASSPLDPEAGRSDTRRGGSSSREPKYWLARHPGTAATWLFTQSRRLVPSLVPTPVASRAEPGGACELGWAVPRAVNSVKTVVLCLSPRKAWAGVLPFRAGRPSWSERQPCRVLVLR